MPDQIFPDCGDGEAPRHFSLVRALRLAGCLTLANGFGGATVFAALAFASC